MVCNQRFETPGERFVLTLSTMGSRMHALHMASGGGTQRRPQAFLSMASKVWRLPNSERSPIRFVSSVFAQPLTECDPGRDRLLFASCKVESALMEEAAPTNEQFWCHDTAGGEDAVSTFGARAASNGDKERISGSPRQNKSWSV